MEKATFKNMELGNLMFGNSRGEYAIPRDIGYEQRFRLWLYDNGFDGYGIHNSGADEIETDVFVIRPYYWGEDEALMDLPNFEYKPTGLKISWYKYPMRDAYSNQNISPKQFKEILEECSKAMEDIRR